jgi:hypothetical protein
MPLTRTLSSGNESSSFLSHMREGTSFTPFPSSFSISQTLKRPAGSGGTIGTRVSSIMLGAGKVNDNSVATQVALCSLYSL